MELGVKNTFSPICVLLGGGMETSYEYIFKDNKKILEVLAIIISVIVVIKLSITFYDKVIKTVHKNFKNFQKRC